MVEGLVRTSAQVEIEIPTGVDCGDIADRPVPSRLKSGVSMLTAELTTSWHAADHVEIDARLQRGSAVEDQRAAIVDHAPRADQLRVELQGIPLVVDRDRAAGHRPIGA